MKPRNTLILFLIAAALGAYIFFYERHQEVSEEGEEKQERAHLFDFEVAEAQAAEIRAGDGPAIRLTKSEEGWSVVAEGGKVYKADKALVEDYFETLRGIEAAHLIEEGDVKAEQFGLADPQKRVSVRGSSKDTPWQHILLIGDEMPIGSRRYVMVEGGKAVRMLDSYVVRQLDKKVTDFRPKEIVSFDKSKVAGIEFSHYQGGKIRLARKEGNWSLEAPTGGGEIDPAKADRLLEDLSLLRVSSFPGEDVGDGRKFGLDKPTRKYVLSDEAGKELVRLEFGNKKEGADGGYYVRATGQEEVLLVSGYSADGLPKTLEDLRPPPPPEPSAESSSGPSGEAPAP
ncbi:MAG: DUF4340 domain-containing protein [Bdellovibrionota bacterium]